MMYAARPNLMDLILPDGSEVEARAYQEADDTVGISHATRFYLPIRSISRSTWPSRVVQVDGLQVRLERHLRTVPATARWADATELPDLWPIARRGLRGLPYEPADGAGIVIVDIVRR